MSTGMDDVRVGESVRVVRRQQGLTQRDVAKRAKCSQQTVSRLEAGQLDIVTLPRCRQIAAAIGMRLEITPRWRGVNLPKLLDQRHATLVTECAARVAARGWEVIPELTFNHYGERGSVDIAAFHRPTGAVLIIEVKSRIVDLQDLFSTLDRKRRLVPSLIRTEHLQGARGPVGVALVVPELSSIRAAIDRHAVLFDASFPGRTREVRAWLAKPGGDMGAVWFLNATASETREAETSGPQSNAQDAADD